MMVALRPYADLPAKVFTSLKNMSISRLLGGLETYV
jgi:hypothetical protein